MFSFTDELQHLSAAVERADKETAAQQAQITRGSITRQRIVEFLATTREASAYTIAKALNLASEATIHHHVRVLFDARILGGREGARGMVYFLRGRG